MIRLHSRALPGLLPFCLVALLLSPQAASEEPSASSLIAHWAFDEDFGERCLDSTDTGAHAAPARHGTKGLQRVEGVFGNAMAFSGRHHLEAKGKPEFGQLDTLSISAWAQPTSFTHYNEIFRKEDGEQRVLFSFQSNGAILSLGLNIDGYVECDATLDPESVRDGGWHLCAATFDGKVMRVYLDGNEIGNLERAGRITATGGASGCIGSTNGNECFQGGIDDLRISRAVLTPGDLARMYQDGCDAIAAKSELLPGDEPSVGAPLLAHWTFNEKGATTVVHGAADDDSLDLRTPVYARRRGVHANALDLRGKHRLEVPLGPRLDGTDAVTFSAWVKPRGLSGNREIFRQECDERLLFSFQDGGSILSLGLNVDGYSECDALIDAAHVLDGAWHHCAGTFDGETMRVYLDGKEVGFQPRKGALVTNGTAPAFIASSGGTGEHFDGGLDDLRLYRQALSAAQIQSLYSAGVDSLAAYGAEQARKVAAFYVEADSFAETLAGSRKNVIEQGIRLDQEMADVAVARLRGAFPEECRDFAEWTGLSPLEYLVSDAQDLNERLAASLVELMLEYKPLTEYQWAAQIPEQHTHWQEAEAIAQRFDTLKKQGDDVGLSPKWLAIVMEAGSRVDFRPKVQEPVAPYVKPSTPETRRLTQAEARDALKRDWLHQADGKPTPERIRDEVRWTGQLLARLQTANPHIDFSDETAALTRLRAFTGNLSEEDAPTYFAVRGLKRRIMFKNPVVDFDQILMVDMPFPQGSEWPHETRHRLGYMAVPGARLLVLEGLSPEGDLRQLMPQPPLHGAFWRPDLSFDAQKVLFCFKPHNEKAYHLYEINVDGTGLVQLTHGQYDDLDPVYLPDGEHILFCTTRGHTYVRCMPPTSAFPLARCDLDGKNIYIISRANEPDYLPSVLDDGRIIYTRWEYTDKPLWRAQGLWTMRPDGTQVNTFWGNQSVWPDLLKDARSIPGSHRVMFTGSAHHNWFNGSVGIVDPYKGLNFPDGLTKVTADTEWPESGNGPVDPVESPNYHASGKYRGYYSPYPLSEKDFIVSANRDGKFVLYLMDVDGNRELIYEGVHNILHALPLRPRVTPPVLEDNVEWPTYAERLNPKGGLIYSNNVYQGAPPELRGKAKYLRVLNIEHKTYTYWHKRPYLSTGPVVSGVQSEGVKRILGTVPIEDDGSVAFRAPSGIPLHFQLLDENYRALHTMRSFTGVMPGESRGCLGCHERHSGAPTAGVFGTAMQTGAVSITPPPWDDRSVSFDRYVRPSLDKYCGKCHQGEGKAREAVDFTPKAGFLGFDEAYWLLTGKPAWGVAYKKPENPPPGFGIAGMIMVEGYDQRDPVAYQTPAPMTKLSYKSKLIEIASSGKHHGVKLDPVDLRRLMVWVDAMCPYRGSEEVRDIPDPEFQGIDWLAVRPVIKSAPKVVRPGPVDEQG